MTWGLFSAVSSGLLPAVVIPWLFFLRLFVGVFFFFFFFFFFLWRGDSTRVPQGVVRGAGGLPALDCPDFMDDHTSNRDTDPPKQKLLRMP
jgi:hypothetical protein